jgi:hypothetical protein
MKSRERSESGPMLRGKEEADVDLWINERDEMKSGGQA